jgi:hypothetical protein
MTTLYEDDYSIAADLIEATGSFCPGVLYRFLTHNAAWEILSEICGNGLVVGYAHKAPAPGKSLDDVVAYLRERAENAPYRERYIWDLRQCVFCSADNDIFSAGAGFPRVELAEMLREAVIEPGTVFSVRVMSGDDLHFIVCGAVDPLDGDTPAPQWLEEVRLVDGEWLPVDGGLHIEAKDGKRVTLREVRS